MRWSPLVSVPAFLQAMPYGFILVPVIGCRPMGDAELQSLSAAARGELQRRHEALQDDLKASLKGVRGFERTAQEQLQALDWRVAPYIVSGLIEDLTEKYRVG